MMSNGIWQAIHLFEQSEAQKLTTTKTEIFVCFCHMIFC